MRDSLWAEPARLQELLARTGEIASLSGKKLMKSAGLSWQTLSSWKAGKRVPRPDSLFALGQTLVLKGERIAEVGRELMRLAQKEQQRRSVQRETEEDVLPLFDAVEESGLFATGSTARATQKRRKA
jgi:hypothetical protein